MSVLSTSLQSGRVPFVRVQMQLEKCSLTYGQGNCLASSGNPCWKTRNIQSDCQSIKADGSYSYAHGTNFFTHNFSMIDSVPNRAEDCHPLLLSIDTAPSTIPDAGGLATISKVTLTFQDVPDNDVTTDDNFADRGYIAKEQGTFFGKLKARHPFIEGSTLYIRKGYYDQGDSNILMNQADYQSSESVRYQYQIESISHPDSNGIVKVIAKDPLRLTDRLKQKLPAPSKGRLTSTIANSATAGATFTVNDSTSYVTIGGQPFKYIRVNKEILEVTISGTTMTIVGRDKFGSGHTADHTGSENDGAAVQLVYYQENEAIYNTVNSLLQAAGIAASYFSSVDIANELTTWRSEYLLTNYITKPTSIAELLRQVTDQCQLIMWFDPIDNKIKTKPVRPSSGTRPVLNDQEHISNLQVKEREDLRLSFVEVLTQPRDYTEKDDAALFVNKNINVDSKYFNLYGTVREKSIFARWLSSATLARTTGSQLINRFRVQPYQVTFDLDPKDFRISPRREGIVTDDEANRGITTGDFFYIKSLQFQNPDGSVFIPEFICTMSDYDHAKQKVKIKAIQYAVSAARTAKIGFVTGNDSILGTTYPPASDALRDIYGWIAPASGNFANGDEPYEII